MLENTKISVVQCQIHESAAVGWRAHSPYPKYSIDAGTGAAIVEVTIFGETAETIDLISVGAIYVTFDSTTNVVQGGPLASAISLIAQDLHGVLIIVCAIAAIRAARAHNLDAHRYWALLTFLFVSGVRFQRIGYAFWTIVTRHAPFGRGALPRGSTPAASEVSPNVGPGRVFGPSQGASARSRVFAGRTRGSRWRQCRRNWITRTRPPAGPAP